MENLPHSSPSEISTQHQSSCIQYQYPETGFHHSYIHHLVSRLHHKPVINVIRSSSSSQSSHSPDVKRCFLIKNIKSLPRDRGNPRLKKPKKPFIYRDCGKPKWVGLVLVITYLTYLIIFGHLNILLVLESKFQSNFSIISLVIFFNFLVLWHGKYLGGSLRGSLRVLVRKQQEVSLLKSLRVSCCMAFV